jgi:hypothetical protein
MLNILKHSIILQNALKCFENLAKLTKLLPKNNPAQKPKPKCDVCLKGVEYVRKNKHITDLQEMKKLIKSDYCGREPKMMQKACRKVVEKHGDQGYKIMDGIKEGLSDKDICKRIKQC